MTRSEFSNETATAELKPCRCGCLLRSIKKDIRGFYIYCANGHSTQYYKTRQDAINAWNKRS